ncbi:MAG TPA: gamma carbonic anhydrase family protein [Nitriliruptoraceae bacterium]|nr:gamma carbonic anhydrase family protein [Nitriliruptoraceae bacterium]
MSDAANRDSSDDVVRITINGHTPRVDPDAFVAPGVVLAGNIEVAAGASIWFGSVLRAEVGRIVIGADSNLQDGTVVHADPDFDVIVGERVTVGHRVMLHGCTIGDDVLVGMAATVLNGADVGARSLVGAGSVVTEGTVVDQDTVVVGTPAKPRDLQLPDVPRPNVAGYVHLSRLYRDALEHAHLR